MSHFGLYLSSVVSLKFKVDVVTSFQMCEIEVLERQTFRLGSNFRKVTPHDLKKSLNTLLQLDTA